MAFDPKQHISQIKGKDYLETKYRIMWFRSEHPLGSIQVMRISENPPVFCATIYGNEGHLLAQGHATAIEKGGEVWKGRAVEKAETAAIGRALGHAGYGTQFAVEGEPDDDSEANHLADSPHKSNKPTNPRQTDPAPTPVAFKDAATGTAFVEWAGSQFDHSPEAIMTALRHVVPELTVIQQWPMSVNEAIAAIMAYSTDYNDKDLKDWFTNLKKIKVLKNSRGDLFNDDQLDTFKTLALKLVKP